MLRICDRILNLHTFVVYTNYLNVINMEEALLDMHAERLSYFGNC